MRGRGRIDQVPDLELMDLVEFNGLNPFGNDYITNGFHQGATYFRTMVSRWKFSERGRIADIGCGYGRWSMFLAEANDFVVGFERNAKAIDLCRKLADFFGLDNTSFVVTDVNAGIAAKDDSFDGVWCFDAMEFFDREKVMREIHRILRPGGMLHLGEYSSTGQLLRNFLSGYEAGGLAHHVTRFALQSLRQGPWLGGFANYGTLENLPQVLGRFGFKVIDNPPPEVELGDLYAVPAELAGCLNNATAIAQLMEVTPELAESVCNCIVSGTAPRNVSLCAVKQ